MTLSMSHMCLSRGRLAISPKARVTHPDDKTIRTIHIGKSGVQTALSLSQKTLKQIIDKITLNVVGLAPSLPSSLAATVNKLDQITLNVGVVLSLTISSSELCP